MITSTGNSGTNGTTGAKNASSSGVLNNGQVMGKDDFLKMLVAQMKNQDPMNPMEGKEFAAQLAQFSTVEQLMQIGSKMDSQTLTGSTTLGAAIVGHEVLLGGDKFTAMDGTKPEVAVDLEKDAAKVTVTVKDASGKTVFTQTFTNDKAGRNLLTLNKSDLPDGTYSYSVTATDAKNATVKATTYTRGTATGMAFSGGQIMLRVNGTLVPIGDIVEVLPVAAQAPAASST